MAASRAFLKAWGPSRTLGAPARRALWWDRRKKQEEWKATEATVPAEKEPVLVCPPLRSKKYIPPEDLQRRLEAHVMEIFGPSIPKDWQKVSLEESRLKYRLLAQLAKELSHAVPNPHLHQMKSVRDVLAFYSTPVKDVSKFDEMSTQELPPNLRIQWQY